jgi:uncharacterized protein (TIGR03435 family)
MIGGLAGSACQSFRGTTMDEFASSISLMQAYEDGSRFAPRGGWAHVVDRTGLTGEYDFELRYNLLARLHSWNPKVPSTGEEGPTLADALKPLGLRLDKRKEKLEVLVLDRVNRTPTEDD